MDTQHRSPLLTRRALLASLAAAGAGLALTACGAAPASPTAAPKAAPTAAPPPPTTAPPLAPTIQAGTGLFTLALLPIADSEVMLKRFKPVVEYLQAEMKLDFKTFVGTDYSATIEALRAKKVDGAWLGPFPYILAADVAGVRPLVVAGTADGKPGTYHSVIVTSKKSGIASLADLRGKSFAFVDPASASGHLIPRAVLVKAGLDPETDMKVTFAGGHDAALLAVHNGKVDAGAIAEAYIRRLADRGQIDPATIAVIARSDPIPAGPVVTRADLDPSLRDRFKDALLRLHEKVGPAVIKDVLGVDNSRLVMVDDALYNPLREVAKILNLDLTKQQ